MSRFHLLRGSRRALAVLAAVVSLGTVAALASPAVADPLLGPTPAPTNATSLTFTTAHDGLVPGQGIGFHTDTTLPATLNKVDAKICQTGFGSYSTSTFGYNGSGGVRCVDGAHIGSGGLNGIQSGYELGPLPFSSVTTSGPQTFHAGTSDAPGAPVSWQNDDTFPAGPLTCDKTHKCDLVVDVGLTGDSVLDTWFIQPLTFAGTPNAPVPTIGGGDIGNTQITVHWTSLAAGIPSGNGTIDKYTIHAVPHSPGVGTCPASGPADTNVTTGFVGPVSPNPTGTSVTATQATITGLANFCQYDFTVTAENVASDGVTHFASTAGGPVSGTPSQPGPVLSGSPADSAVDLSWSAVGGATSYRVTSSAGPCVGGCNVGNVLLDHLTGLTNGTSYTFTVAAQIGIGGPFTAESNPVTLTPNGALIHQTISVIRPQGTLVISQYCSGLPVDINGNFDPSNNNGNAVPNAVPNTNCNLTLSGPRPDHLQNDAISASPRSTTDAVTNGTTTVTSQMLTFTANDLNQLVTGDGMPAGARIVAVPDAHTVTLSAPASISFDGGQLAIVGTTLNFGTVGAGYPASISYDGGTGLTAGHVNNEIEGLMIPGGSHITNVASPSTIDISAPADGASNGFTTREWLVAPTPAHLITSGPHAGQYFQATGELRQVMIVDTRPGDTGWTATGQVTDFTDASSHTFSGNDLGWEPKAVHAFSQPFNSPDGSYSMAPANGALVTPGTVPGLHSGTTASTDSLVVGSVPGQTLGYAFGGHGLGLAQLDADLTLWMPVFTQAGSYTGTITLTAI
ncbi:MAG TPA: hypothetical protein VEP49_20555 [Acidimicrobiia bacterium]|nr:hypothetical protein [Acidimicrobiia bacterium]